MNTIPAHAAFSAVPFPRFPTDAVAAPPVSEAEASRPSIVSQQASTFFHRLLNRAGSGPELAQAVADYLLRSGVQAVWIVPQSGKGHWDSPVALNEGQGTVLELVSGMIHTVLESWKREDHAAGLQAVPLRELPSSVLILAPVVLAGRITDALVAIAPATSRSGIPVDWMVSLAAHTLAIWQAQSHHVASRDQNSFLTRLIELFTAMDRSESESEMRMRMVNSLKHIARSDHTALVLKSGAALRLVAISDVEHLDPQSEASVLVRSIGDRLPERTLVWKKSPPGANAEEAAALPSSQSPDSRLPAAELDEWCESFSLEHLILVPVRDDSGALAGWVWSGYAKAAPVTEPARQSLEQAVALAGTHWLTLRRGHQSVSKSFVARVWKGLAARAAKLLAATAAVLLLVLMVPVPYRIACDCQLQPVSRRFVAAPWNGMLDQSLVSAGDVVSAGQIVAVMDSTPLRMELSSLHAELDSQRKRRDSSLAKGDIAESQIAASEMSRIESKIGILTDRLGNTEIRSPLAGVVVSGDLDKAEGVPMETGQTLFEVAPLDRMQVEVLVPEREFRMVAPGMKVEFEFDAFPFRTFAGKIARVHPRAEVIDSRNVFVAEIEITNPDSQLRPGMKGRARIHGPRHSLGWNLFHHSWDSARRWWVW